jgi:hypothetical protein
MSLHPPSGVGEGRGESSYVHRSSARLGQFRPRPSLFRSMRVRLMILVPPFSSISVPISSPFLTSLFHAVPPLPISSLSCHFPPSFFATSSAFQPFQFSISLPFAISVLSSALLFLFQFYAPCLCQIFKHFSIFYVVQFTVSAVLCSPILQRRRILKLTKNLSVLRFIT